MKADFGTDWREFFDSHAERYEENPFTKHTIAEVEFFLSLFPLARGASILDMGCGTGRHSIELAARGYRVTGVDLSEGMLAVARRNAAAAGIDLPLVQGDARSVILGQAFEAAICLCEGGFGLLGVGDDPETHDQAILDNISRHLAPGAPFLLTALNGYSIIRQMKDEMVLEGHFDTATMLAAYQDEWNLPEGMVTIAVKERLFIAPEVVRMLREAGFRVDAVYGGTAGQWCRRPLMLDEVEAMYVCRKV